MISLLVSSKKAGFVQLKTSEQSQVEGGWESQNHWPQQRAEQQVKALTERPNASGQTRLFSMPSG